MLKRQQAAQFIQAARDDDLNSIEGPNEELKQIRNVVQSNFSDPSSLTDLSDNTDNQDYFNATAVDDASGKTGLSTTSLKSLKLSDLEEVITPNMSPEEMKQQLDVVLKMRQKREREKADRFLALAMAKLGRNNDINSNTSGTNTNEEHDKFVNDTPMQQNDTIDEQCQDEGKTEHDNNVSSGNDQTENEFKEEESAIPPDKAKVNSQSLGDCDVERGS